MTPTLTRTMKLHRVQHAFRHSSAVYRAFTGGRGAGKSFVGAYDLIRRARRGRLYMVGAPTYPMLQDSTIRTFLGLARDLGVVRDADVRKTPPSVRLTTGAEVIFRSGENPERFRGPNLSGVWLDEGSLLHRDAFEIAIACLREGGDQGWLSSTFTPKGRTHWTCDVFASGRPGSELFRARTDQNPFLPPDFVRQLLTQYSGLRALQELGGEFVDLEGAEWPPEYFPDSLWFRDWPEHLVATALALDPSKGRDARAGDYSAFVWGGVDSKGVLWVDADLGRRPTPQIVSDGIGHFRRFNPAAFAVEVNQYQELLAVEFARVGAEMHLHLPLYGINNTEAKDVRIRRVGPYLARGELRVRDTPGGRLLVEQLREFPEGEHDDGPDALEMLVRMLLWLLGQRGGAGQPRVLRA